MRVQIELCVGTCPTCGADIDVASEREEETVAISCGRRDCQLEFRNADFREWLDQRVSELEIVLRAGRAFVQKKSRAA
jgi:hypothetical protein